MNKIRKHFSRKDGVALITTLMVVALLVGIVVEFNRIAIADIDISKNFGDDKKILFLTISGVNAIKELLRLEGLYSTSDNLLEEWAKSRTYFESASSMLDEGKIEGQIYDENGKINVNSLINAEGKFDETQKAIWEKLLGQSRFALTEEDVNTILYGVKDWIDKDDEITGIYGAEDSFYRGKGYQCKNNALEQIEEMLFINGVTDDIFYGNQYKEGIQAYFTVYGNDQVNINTAPLPVLMALSGDMSEEIASEMDEYRKLDANREQLQIKTWYKTLWPFENMLPENILTTSSDVFKIQMKGTLRESVKQVKAVIFRSKTATNIIYWQEN